MFAKPAPTSGLNINLDRLCYLVFIQQGFFYQIYANFIHYLRTDYY